MNAIFIQTKEIFQGPPDSLASTLSMGEAEPALGSSNFCGKTVTPIRGVVK